MLAIGLMSGTSVDGVDVALVETDGEDLVRPRGGRVYPYTEEQRAILRRAALDAVAIERRTERPGVLAEAEALTTRLHGDAVERFLAETGLAPADVEVVGFHGQTVLHRPERALTVQLGDGAALARRLGIPVVYDLRAADMQAGGQGAPLVPIFHRAMAASAGLAPPFAILNIGGVANVTFAGPDGELVGFDTGPGNGPLDDWVLAHTGCRFDQDGALSATGRPDEAVIARIMADPYFAAPPPKSLDRDWLKDILAPGMDLADGCATLADLTARTIASSRRFAPAEPACWVVAGGGTQNPDLMRRLRRALGVEVPVMTAGDLPGGWSADLVEAQAFAYLAVRRVRELPITFPGTTGCRQPTIGGALARP